MDLDDLLEDLWGDATRGARDRAGDHGRDVRRRVEDARRMPGVRRRVRSAVLYASSAWVALFGGLGIAAEVAIDGGGGTALALLLGGIALPGLGSGLWAWRAQRAAAARERELEAAARAKRERTELPADVRDEWVRLRKAQALVEDLAEEGLVAGEAVAEVGQTVEELRVLLVADRRAAELGAAPSGALRRHLGEVADLLVALSVEAVEHRAGEVGGTGRQATLVEARDRLESLRRAREEVARAERGGDAAAAAEWIEREAAAHRADEAARRQPPDGTGEQRSRAG